jgi:hypothetical protein
MDLQTMNIPPFFLFFLFSFLGLSFLVFFSGRSGFSYTWLEFLGFSVYHLEGFIACAVGRWLGGREI